LFFQSGPTRTRGESDWLTGSSSIRSIISIARTSTCFIGLTHSNTLGPWVLDSSATNHIIGNNFFSLLYLLKVMYLVLRVTTCFIPFCLSRLWYLEIKLCLVKFRISVFNHFYWWLSKMYWLFI